MNICYTLTRILLWCVNDGHILYDSRSYVGVMSRNMAIAQFIEELLS